MPTREKRFLGWIVKKGSVMPRGRTHFVFDLDGTILSSTPFYHAILETIFSRNGLILTQEDKKLAMGLSARSFLAPKLKAEALDEALCHLRDQSKFDIEHIPLFEGIDEILHMLHRRGDRLAIWTSRDKASALSLLEKRGIIHFFEVVVSADCIIKHKPDPEGLFLIANVFGCVLADMVMIGDHDVDILAAKATGALPIRANWHGYMPGAECDFGALTIHSVQDLAAILTRDPGHC